MGKVVHFEIPAEDMERAQKFYQDVFGWHVNPMPQMQYTIVHTGPTDDKTGMSREAGFINGGMFKRDKTKSHPIITLDVASIDESLKQVEAHGGKTISARQPVGDMGFVAYFTDSEGNLMGLWENAKK